eukprot:Nk52_evm34s1401 gene=Nk52_evmTU34s1401
MTVNIPAKPKYLYDYLLKLPSAAFEKLYRDQSACLAVYRSLSPITQQLVIRLLYVTDAVSSSVFKSWVSADFRESLPGELKRLCALNVCKKFSQRNPQTNKKFSSYQITETFARGLKTCLFGSTEGVDRGIRKENRDKRAPSLGDLEVYTKKKWESILHFLVGSQKEATPGVKYVLDACNLRKPDGITSEGFQFLLEDLSTQLWEFMFSYLETCEGRGLDIVEVISFLFHVGYAKLGRCFPVENLSATEQVLLQDLFEFGLVYRRKASSRWYYSTKLAYSLVCPHQDTYSFDSNSERGYIVVETNYRIYAYTNSALSIALLGLFVDLTCRFPNLAVGIVTRESVNEALANGISADQIIKFLMKNAHPQLKNQTPVIPGALTDQIFLWEMERNRLHRTPAYLYDSFNSLESFRVLREYAREIGVLLWSSEEIMSLCVTKEGHDPVKKHWKKMEEASLKRAMEAN